MLTNGNNLNLNWEHEHNTNNYVCKPFYFQVTYRVCYAQGPQQRPVPHATMDMACSQTEAVVFVELDSTTMARISLVQRVWSSFR